MDHIGLGCVQRRRVMSDVLGAEKRAIRERLEKYTRLYQARDRFEPEPADSANFLAHLAKLRYTIRIEFQPLYSFQILRAGVSLMGRRQRRPNCAPNSVLLWSVRSVRNRFPRLVAK